MARGSCSIARGAGGGTWSGARGTNRRWFSTWRPSWRPASSRGESRGEDPRLLVGEPLNSRPSRHIMIEPLPGAPMPRHLFDPVLLWLRDALFHDILVL